MFGALFALTTLISLTYAQEAVPGNTEESLAAAGYEGPKPTESTTKAASVDAYPTEATKAPQAAPAVDGDVTKGPVAAAEAKTTAASVSEAYPTDATTVAVPAEAYPAEPTTTPPPPPPEANPYEQPVVAEPEDKNRVHGAKNRRFPLESCYVNKDGFMCCNKDLEELMDKVYNTLANSRNGKWKKCNIHQVAVAVQRAAKDRFDVDFEAVSGAGDFSAKINFSSDLVCKIKRDSAFMLAYATPLPEASSRA
ncbi:Protein GRD-15 [Aphelenchoides avenae]|nr:Protein GRD-15 [Aphelenchus avenae]